MYFYRLLLVLVGCMALGAEKPSPFVARKSEPAVVTPPPVAPVSPIRGARPRPFAGVAPVVGGIPSVAPVVRQPAAASAAVAADAVSAPAPMHAVASSAPAAAPAAEVAPIVPTPMVVAVIVPPKPPQMEAVQPGAARADVVSKLGNPATSIEMYEEGAFIESLRYEWKGAWVGTVRLTNGKVRQIDTPR